MVSSPQIAFRDSSFIVAMHDRIVIAITEGDSTLAAIDAWAQHMDMAARAYPDGIGAFFVIGKTAVVPSGVVRARASEMFKSLAGKLQLMGTVIEGSGFASATKRAAFTLISSAAIGAVRNKVSSNIDDGAAWFASEAARVRLPCPAASELSALVASIPRPGATS